jgi:hypothetical protein
MKTLTTTSVPVRGCGTRVRGGLYAETHLSEDGNGLPIEAFLLDPPLRLDFGKLGVTAIGTKMIERAGVFHLIDLVGSVHYPNVADYIEEVRRFGVSRRLSGSTDFSKLTSESRLLMGHTRGFITNFSEYAADWRHSRDPKPGHPEPRCPKGIVSHDQDEAPVFCAGVYWQDVEGGKSIVGRKVLRTMPSFSYEGTCRPDDVVPNYECAIFASFPIHRLVGIVDKPAKDAENARILGASSIPSVIVSA